MTSMTFSGKERGMFVHVTNKKFSRSVLELKCNNHEILRFTRPLNSDSVVEGECHVLVMGSNLNLIFFFFTFTTGTEINIKLLVDPYSIPRTVLINIIPFRRRRKKSRKSPQVTTFHLILSQHESR